MPVAAVPQLVVDAGAAAGALAAVVLFAGLVGRSRPMRWLWRTTVKDPLAGFFRAQVAHEVEPRIAEVAAQLRPNGGHSAFDRLAARLDSVERGQRKIFAQLGASGSLDDETDPSEEDAD